MALLPPEHLQTTKVIHSRWLFKGVMVHEKKANAGHRRIKIHPVQQELPEFRPVYRQASCIKVDPSISTTSMSFFFFLAIAVSNDHCFPAVGKTPCWQNTIALHVDGGESRNFLSFNPWPALGRSYTACVSFLQPWVTGKKFARQCWQGNPSWRAVVCSRVHLGTIACQILLRLSPAFFVAASDHGWLRSRLPPPPCPGEDGAYRLRLEQLLTIIEVESGRLVDRYIQPAY